MDEGVCAQSRLGMIEPVSVRLEASSHCQLRCPSCRTTDGSIDQAIGKGFGSNAFTGGLAASVNSEKTTYTRKMLRANAASRADIPCATCEIYLGMQRRGKRLERPEDREGLISAAASRGQPEPEAVAAEAEWQPFAAAAVGPARNIPPRPAPLESRLQAARHYANA